MACEPYIVNDIKTFLWYVERNLVSECNKFLEAYPELLKQQNKAYRETPLHIAAKNPKESEVIDLFLRRGADVTARNYWRQTPLHYAAKANNVRTMRLLLNTPESDANCKDVNGYTPLHMFVLSNDKISDSWVEGFKLLVEANADINAKTNYGQSVLHLIASTKHGAKILAYILHHFNNVDWTATNSSEENFLHTLFRNTRCEKYINILLEIDLKFRDKTVLKRLLDHQDLIGATPWFAIVDRVLIDKDKENLKKIVEIYGASVNSSDNLGNTALHIVVGRDGASFHCDIVGMLLKNNINVNFQNVFGQTAISVLFIKEVFETVIEGNANFESSDRWGRTPLVVILNQNPMPHFVERMLKEKCVDLKSIDIYGSTPLHFAAYNGFEEQVKLLLQYGSDTDAVDQLGDTPMKTAERHGNSRCHKLIAEAMRVSQRKDDKNFFQYTAPQEIKFSYFFEIPNLNEILVDFPSDLRGYSEFLLKKMHISRRPTEENAEDFEIIADVKIHVEKMCQYVKDYDSRFEMTVFPTGSTVEGTKVGHSDEFDFVLCLENLGKQCDIKPPDKIDPAYTLLQFKDNPAPEDYISFSDAYGYFVALPFLMYLFRYIRRALHERKLWEKGNLYYRYEDKIRVISGKPVFNFQMYWIGSKYKQLALSIDLVPAVYKRGWWPENIFTDDMELMTESVRTQGCFLLMQTMKNDFNENWYTISDDSIFSTCNITKHIHKRRLLRISVAPAEIALMKSLPEIYRRAYALAKIMKSVDICPTVEIDVHPRPRLFRNFEIFKPKPVNPSREVKSYWLKNSTFFVAEEQGLNVPENTNPLDVTILIYKKLTELTKSWRLRPYLLPQTYLLEFGSAERRYSNVIDTFILRRKICLDIVMGILGQPFPLKEEYGKWVEQCERNKNERDREHIPQNLLLLGLWRKPSSSSSSSLESWSSSSSSSS